MFNSRFYIQFLELVGNLLIRIRKHIRTPTGFAQSCSKSFGVNFPGYFNVYRITILAFGVLIRFTHCEQAPPGARSSKFRLPAL